MSHQDIELSSGDRLRIDSKREFVITEVLSKPQDAGMSSVYLAHRVDKPEMFGVIKVAKVKNVDALTREAEALKRLQNGQNPHPHIIRLVHPERAMWKERQGNQVLHFFALEYMDGGSLKDRLEREPGGRLPLLEANAVVQAVGQALIYIHEQGMIHLDVKPANVLFSRNGRIVLSDFGVTRTEEQLRAVKKRIGTWFYNSPEQLNTSPEHTRKADIYALGIMLFEMLVGAQQFRQHRASSASVSHSSAGGSDDKQPISAQYASIFQKPPRALNSNIPKNVERVILKAIAPNPAERYDSVQAMLHDLQSAAQPAQGGRNRWLIVALILGGLVAIASIAGGILLANQPNDVVAESAVIQTPTDTLPEATSTVAPVVVIPEEPPSSTPTPVPNTSTPIPTPTDTKPAVNPTSTRRPTSTKVPTATPTATSPPRPAAPAATSPSTGGKGSVIPAQQWMELISPQPDQSIQTADFEFSWRWQDQSQQNVCIQLPSGYAFEIRIWRDGLNKDGAMNAAEQQVNIQCDPATGIFRYTLKNVKGASGVAGETGAFLTDVVIVQLQPYQVILQTGESTYRIFID